ncbi:MAG TPA: hypothetical protein VM287_14530 [Egibacteraceae bacterium]|nr:hypothetical protein [Egibacteraceae bacterium]
MSARKAALAALLAGVLAVGGVACEPAGEEGGGTETPTDTEES